MGAANCRTHSTDAKYLAILLNGEQREQAERETRLPHARVPPLRDSQLDAGGRHFFGRDTKLVIARPDGYVGFRGSIENRSHWNEYADHDGLV